MRSSTMVRWSCIAVAGAVVCHPVHAENLLRLRLPVLCEPGGTCVVQNYVDHDPSAGARDHACGGLTYDGHDGTDFRLRSLRAMREGVAVVSAAHGRVARVRDGVADVPFRGSEAIVPIFVDRGAPLILRDRAEARQSLPVIPQHLYVTLSMRGTARRPA